jgi:hypothetical protein
MLDPKERLKRVFVKINEDLEEHENLQSISAEQLSNKTCNINPAERLLANYHYHDGYTDALQRPKLLARSL